MKTIPVNVPRAVITLDRPRTMTLQLDAIKRIKDQTGSFDIPSGDEMFERAPTIIWCAFVDGDREDLTPEDVAGMIHAGNLAAVVGALSDLVGQSSPKASEGKALPVPEAVRRRASRR